MAIPDIKFAVYYGTIRLDDGTIQTLSAPDVAALYNVSDLPYLPVPLNGPTPFQNGPDELSYAHLKPLSNGQYYDAKQRYNFYNEIQYDDDFVVGQGKWARRPQFDNSEDV